MARLQSEFCTKDFLFELRIFLRKMLRNFPRNFEPLCSVGQKKSRKIPAKFPTKFSKFPCEKSKKIHRRASAGAQGESNENSLGRKEAEPNKSANWFGVAEVRRPAAPTPGFLSKNAVYLGFFFRTRVSFPEGPKIKKFRDFERDRKFRARMKFSSEPPTAALFFVGKSRRRD